MAKTMNAIVLVLAVAATTVFMLNGAEAAEYTVGDELGWAIPPGGSATYAAWAARHSLIVNDVLDFNFTVGEQDLALVTKEDFDACNTANPLIVFQYPGKFHFLREGTFYLTCTYAGHCTKGQKIALYFSSGSAAPSPSPTPSASPCESQTYGVDAEKEQVTAVKFVSKKAYGFKKIIPSMMKSL